MANSSNTQTNMNQAQMDPKDQTDNLNQNENQNSGLNGRSPTTMNKSLTQHITSNTFVFTTPIKLTQNKLMFWRSQVISSIRANEREGFVDGSHVCPLEFS